MTGIPVLTYHSLHAPGDGYASNDHVALAADLVTLMEAGYEVVSLGEIVDRLLQRDADWFMSGGKAGISFDDGCNHDFLDFSHPGLPTLKSFNTLLAEFNRRHAPPRPARATSFVIASPVATEILDRTCIAGRGDWHSGWWRDAVQGGLLDIGSHGWDHLHPSLPFVCHTRGARDDFSQVDNAHDAAMQIEQAEAYIRQVIGAEHAIGLFAYPGGKASRYLVEEYFPAQGLIRAAFGTGGQPVSIQSNRWHLPRYVCGEHWSSPAELAVLLQPGR